MSSVLVARKAPSFHPSVPISSSCEPRTPASTVRDTTCFTGGSEIRNAAAADDEIRADGAEFGARPEAGHAVIEAGSDHEMVVVSEQLIVVGGLQRKTACRRPGRRPVDLAKNSCGVEGIGELGPAQAIRRRRVIAEAKQGRVGCAWPGAGRIGVDRLLVEDPHMGRAFDRPGWRS